MRKTAFYILPLCLGLLCLVSCGGNKKKVHSFAESFAGYVNQGQTDSMKAMYPSAEFDMEVPLSVDSITVNKTDDPNIFKVDYSSSKWIEVKINENGSMEIVKSKGIASLPAADRQLAESTGMFAAAASDADLINMANDQDFRNWLSDKAYDNFTSQVTLKEGASSHNSKMDWDDYGEYSKFLQGQLIVEITNNSKTPIDASDYVVSFTDKHWNCCDVEGWGYSKKTAPGQTIAPGETVTVTLKTGFTEHWNGWDAQRHSIKPVVTSPSINWKISKEAIINKYQANGTEYQEYAKSK